MGNNLGVQGFELIPVSRLNMGIPDKSRLVIRAGDQRIADQVIYCNSRDSRRKGLLGRRILASDENTGLSQREIGRRQFNSHAGYAF